MTANIYSMYVQTLKTAIHLHKTVTYVKLECGPNAQCDGRPAKYRWRPLFNSAKFG